MDFLLWTAGARPSQIMHIRRDDITEEDEYGVEWRKHGKDRDASYLGRRTRTQWYFIGTTGDYYELSDDESSFSRPKSRSSRAHSSSSGRRQSHRKSSRAKDPVWDKRRARVDEESSSEESEYDEDNDGDYDIPPPQMYPPMFHHPHAPQPGPPPPPQQGGDMPAFFKLN